jgi:hypothetical protein
LRALAEGDGLNGTILDPAARWAWPVALAEHFHYPYTEGLLPRYTQNIAAAIVGRRKVIARREGFEHYDLSSDPDERSSMQGSLEVFEAACRRDGAPAAAVERAVQHLTRWSGVLTGSGPPTETSGGAAAVQHGRLRPDGLTQMAGTLACAVRRHGMVPA